MYETFDHTADLGLRIRASNLPTLLAEAGRALFSVIVAGLETVAPNEIVAIRVEGEVSELLLFDWLSELLYLYETRRILFTRFDVAVTPEGVTAQAYGEPLDPARHMLDHEVKAITYHQLKLEQQPDGWLAEVIIDI